ncbi:Xylanase inhibitor, C-terminal [Sesbania bispinosa]|nr:Xylanase inhibitor, C-terminal [Sesbania bispinosa]
MASFPLFFTFLYLVVQLSHAQSPVSFLLPVTKDNSTLQYLTTLSYGTPFVPTKLVLDLGGPLLWLDCASRNTPSSSTLTTPHRSIQCLTATPHQVEATSFLSSPTDQECQILQENSITGKVARGEFVEDLMALHSSAQELVRFTCSPSMLLNGLAKGVRGMVGLGRSRSSLPSQVFDSLSTHRKLTLCLSSSIGVVLLGNMAYEAEILKSLTFTPLITNQNQRYPSSQEYFINVNSIKINGKRLSLNQEGNGGALTRLSSIVPYTTMQSSIYATFKTAFMEAAMSMNMTRLAEVAPFELCFSSRDIGESQVGPSVPIIELVLQSEMVKWSIYGRNSMVRVSNEVMCLGFLDGGLNQRNPIVIGGYQLEDVIVQLDLATSMLGFSSSLLTENTVCSDFKVGFMPLTENQFNY